MGLASKLSTVEIDASGYLQSRPPQRVQSFFGQLTWNNDTSHPHPSATHSASSHSTPTHPVHATPLLLPTLPCPCPPHSCHLSQQLPFPSLSRPPPSTQVHPPIRSPHTRLLSVLSVCSPLPAQCSPTHLRPPHCPLHRAALVRLK